MLKKLIQQFSKFVLIGMLNTGIDFAVLNLLMRLFSVYEGSSIIPIKAVAFFTANINSYFCNKYWTFRQEQKKNISQEYGKFLIISAIALGIHLMVIYSITTLIPPILMSKELWANFANIVAVGLALIWNFIGYKFLVFKK